MEGAVHRACLPGRHPLAEDRREAARIKQQAAGGIVHFEEMNAEVGVVDELGEAAGPGSVGHHLVEANDLLTHASGMEEVHPHGLVVEEVRERLARLRGGGPLPSPEAMSASLNALLVRADDRTDAAKALLALQPMIASHPLVAGTAPTVYTPHRPPRPEKSEGGKAFRTVSEFTPQGDQPVALTHDIWWVRKREQLLELANKQVNAYVYDRETVSQAARNLLNLSSVDRVLYAVKANFNAALLRVLADEGVDFECVSPGEVEWIEQVIPDIDLGRILFTPNFAPREEYEWGIRKGLQVTLDNLYPLEAWPELFREKELFIRIDPGKGRGHHENVKTAGLHSKFGIPRFEIDELKKLVDDAGAEVIGIHAHSGSGILDPDNWRAVAVELVEVAKNFPSVRFIDLGGGIGVPDKPGEKPFDLEKLDRTLNEIRDSYPQYELWLEPGRYLVAQAGVLLTRVTQLKGKGDMRYVGVGTGMNSLIRPALYGSYHEIVNLSKAENAATELVTVVGPICETGDRLGSDRLMPRCEENDVILIANAGAYGYVMSSQYNRREVATEVVI